VFSDRTISRVVIARFVARAGGEAAFFVGVWGMAAYRFDASASQIALLMAVLAVSAMVGSTVAGVLVDRYGPRNVLVGAQVVYAPVAIGVTFVPSLAVLTAAVALFGLATAPIMTASGSFPPYLTDDPERIESINSLFEGAGALAFVIGPGTGALLAGRFGIDSVFWLDAVLTTLGALLVLPVATPPKRVSGEKHPLRELVDGLALTYRMPSLRYYVLTGTLVWFSFGAFGALEPLFYRDVVGTGVETIGYMNSLFGAGIAFGAWMLTRLPAKATSARGLAIIVALVGAGAGLYVGTTNLVIIGLGSLVWGTVIGAVEPLLRTLMQLDAPEEYVGRVMGTAQVHRHAGEIVPLALAPGLAAAFGVQAVMIGGGFIATVVALASLGFAARIDRDRGEKPAPGRVHALEDDPISPIT
jgi:MFS family permease